MRKFRGWLLGGAAVAALCSAGALANSPFIMSGVWRPGSGGTGPQLLVVDVTSIWTGDFAYWPQQQQQVTFSGEYYFNSGASICRVAIANFTPSTLQHFDYTSLVFGAAGLGNTISGLRQDSTQVLGLTSVGTSGGVSEYTGLTFSGSNFDLPHSTGTNVSTTAGNGIGPFFGYAAYYSGNIYGTQGEPDTGPPTNTKVYKVNTTSWSQTAVDLSGLGVTNVNGDALVDVANARVLFGAPTSGKLVSIPLSNFTAGGASVVVNLASVIPDWASGVSPAPTRKRMHAWLDDADTNLFLLYQTTLGGVSVAKFDLATLTYRGSFDLTVAYAGGFAGAVDRPIDGWTWANGHTWVLSSSVNGPLDNGVTRVIDIQSNFSTSGVQILNSLNSNVTAGYSSWTSDGTSFYSQPVYVDLGVNTFVWKYTPGGSSPPPPPPSGCPDRLDFSKKCNSQYAGSVIK